MSDAHKTDKAHREKTLKSETIYEGKILDLRKDEVTVRDGNTSTREIVEHRGAVGILAVTQEKKLILVKQYRKPAENFMLEIPAGKIEKNENDHAEAALRELREETGYRAKKIKPLLSFYPSVGYSTEIIHLFLACELTPGETDFDENESIETFEYTLDELMEMINHGEIEDGKTIISILLANSFNLLL